jgi:hypothetical protein
MKALAASLALAAVVAAGGGASPSVCRFDPQTRLTAEERELRQAIRVRKSWGFPHDCVFVRRVNADLAARRPPSLYAGIPLTSREAAYLRLRQRMEASERLYAYLEDHPDVDGGASLEDDYPDSPYMLVHLKGDPEAHRREIAERYPFRFVLRQADHSVDELRRIQDSIDFERLKGEGITAHVVYVSKGRVRVEVVSAREDAEERLHELYGPALDVKVVARSTEPSLVCNSPSTYRVSRDGRRLTLTYGDSGSVDPLRVEVVESAREVRVGIVTSVPFGFITDDLRTHTLSVRLDRPLGGRVVRSIETRRRVRQERR